MNIDKDFWFDLDMEKDLENRKGSGLRNRVPLHFLKGAKYVFYNIYSYINRCIISKI